MGEVHIMIDIIGWVGAISLLAAYLLISNGKLSAKTYGYQGLNLLGSVCLIINSYSYGTIPLVALNTTWLLIGLYTIGTFRKEQ